MDMGFDHTAWPQAAGNAALAPGSFDWQALRARFLAAHACRAALSAEDGATGGGSFHVAAAEVLAGYVGATGDINPNALANGKGDRATEAETLGQPGRAIEGDDD